MASIDKQVGTITKKVDSANSKAIGTDKAPRVKPGGMPTHVAVEHGVRPPVSKNSSILGQGQNAYNNPN